MLAHLIPISRRSLLYGISLALLLGLAGCSDDDSSAPSSESVDSPVTGSIFETSPIARERFATVAERASNPMLDQGVLDTVVTALNDFSLDVHRQQAASAASQNSVSSGYSIATAISLLRLTASGAIDASFASLTRTEGVAEADLHQAMNQIALDLNSRTSDDVAVRVANRLVTQPDIAFSDAFLDSAVEHYGAPATEIDFFANNDEALELINRWVNDQTDGLIPNLLSEVSPETITMLVNAIVLDALWEPEFVARPNHAFTNSDGGQVSVDGFGEIVRLAAVSDSNLSAVEVPYRGGDVAMLIVQPSDLTSFESTLDASGITALRQSLIEQQVSLSVPEWQTTSRFEPHVLLSSLGWPANPLPLDDLLAPSEPAALYELASTHQALIEVDRSGTRAAAATAIGIGVTSVPVVDVTININQPFIYALIDRPSGLILFTGRTVSL